MKMKKYLLLPLCLAACLILSSCSFGGKDVRFSVGNAMSTAFQIGDMKCPREEALLYLLNYKNLYSEIEDQNLWTGAFDGTRLTSSLKTSCVDILSEVYILNLYAKENDIGLSDSDPAKLETAAREYFASLTAAEKKFCGVKEKDVYEMYVRYATAEKVYASLMDTVDEEVSEDEARIMVAYVLHTKDPAGAQAAASALAAGTSFDTVLATYGDGDKTEQSFGRNTYPAEVEEVIFRLENNEVSPLLISGDDYYIVRCVNKYDETLSEENKTKILEGRKSSVLTKLFEEADDKYYSRINKSFWESISLSPETDAMETRSYFLTLDKYYKN